MHAYPTDDFEYQDHTIDAVEVHNGTYTIKCDGWCMCGDDSPVQPKVGDTARFYGRGIGFRIRGLFINGARVWYRTPAEDDRKADEDAYGKDSQEWLDRWDADKGVWSIELGGLGPGYEQCIQITAAEALRWLLQNKPKPVGATWKAVGEELQTAMFANEKVTRLGLSGAQYGAAVSFAARLYELGPIAVLTDERVKDRKVQVCRTFPQG